MSPLTLSSTEIIRFSIVLLRISGIMIFAPFFSSQSIAVQVRVVFALVAAMVLSTSLPASAIPPGLSLANIAGLFLNEALFGVILGFAASFVFAGLQFAGQIISFQLGFSLINLIDPQTEVEAPVFSFLQNYVGLLFFLLLNGHHWFLQAVSESFRYLPVGGVHLQAPLMEHIIRLSSQILVIGLRIAGPIIAITVVTDVVMGVIGRAAPQINIMIVGMPLKLLVGFGCLSFSFYFLPSLLASIYSSLYTTLFSLLHAMN
jgi:flagellar biosynthesis protein FliR